MNGNNDFNKKQNNNNDINNNTNQSKQNQQDASTKQAGELAGRAAFDVATGGEYEKIRKIPGLGKLAKKEEEKIGKRFNKIDKMSGGRVGKVANKAKESGALDALDKGMNASNGKMPNNTPKSVSNNSPQNNSNKPNFAKNGVNNNQNDTPNGNSEGANQSRLRNIFDRKKGIKDLLGLKGDSNKKSLFDRKSKPEENETAGDQVAKMSAKFAKKMIKMVMGPFISAFFIFFLILCFVLLAPSDKNDLTVVDEYNKQQKENGNNDFNYGSYSFDDPKQESFYKRVLETRSDYNKNSKEVNAMYVMATYHILNRDDKVSYDDITEDVIKEMYEGMLGSSTTYSKETYTQFLKEKFLPRYYSDSDKIERVIDDIYEYIDEYLGETNQKEKECSTTTGSSCKYVFDGIHGLNTGKISLSNIQVRLMSSSDCPGGTDNVVLDESLIPFEEYVLGVGYGELGPNYNEEVTKVHLIAARSFALARPYSFKGAMGVKLIQENNSNIIQLRSCVADQVFCNTEKGCSSDYDLKTCKCQPMIYSGSNSHKYTYQQPLNNYPNSKLKSSWMETMGMVAVDKDNKVVSMPYAINNLREDPQDPRVWLKWANQGMNYKQIIMAAYKNIADIKQANCSDTTESSENGFLTTAHEIWTEITNTFGDYTNGNMVPPTNKTIDCSTYVDWVLYKYGYEDFKGYQKVTQWFVTTDLNAKYGWTEIPVAAGEDVTNKLQPGDILVRDPGNNDGHMNIISEIRSDGSVWGYDCGDDSHWKSSRGGKAYNVSSFVKGDTWRNKRRPGKIIRVTNSGTGGTCDTAEAGEWSTWRQNGKAPWASIPLGNSKETIGTAGCYVTSIAIQVARSGVKTNLTNFNPGTFVTELNKSSNSFDSSTGGLTGSGEARISTIVPGFKKAVNYVELPNDKSKQINMVQEYIDKGYYVVLHLDRGRHWVAVTGTTSDNIQMVDPGRDNTNVYDAYPVSSVVGFSVFEIK